MRESMQRILGKPWKLRDDDSISVWNHCINKLKIPFLCYLKGTQNIDCSFQWACDTKIHIINIITMLAYANDLQYDNIYNDVLTQNRLI